MLAPSFLSLGSVCLKCEGHWYAEVWPRVPCPLQRDFTLPPLFFPCCSWKREGSAVCWSYLGSGWYVFLLVEFQFQPELIQGIYSWANVLPLVLWQTFWTSVKLSLFLLNHHVLAILPLAPPWSWNNWANQLNTPVLFQLFELLSKIHLTFQQSLWT